MNLFLHYKVSQHTIINQKQEKMKRLLHIMIMCLIIGNISFAGIVHTEKAATVAKKFMLTNQDIDLDTLFLAKTISKNGHELCYIFNFPENAGFIVIAATDQVIPVLAFSDANEYNDSDDQPPQFIAWMNNYYDQIKFVIDNNLQADETIRDEWLFYSDSEPIERETPFRSVNPLLSTTWDQGCYYNGLCPLAAGGPVEEPGQAVLLQPWHRS
jgi:hypothetical protein